MQVERLLRERRNEYNALQGWEGPHRYAKLPISQLTDVHDDPRVVDGLAVIQTLDEQLREADLKARHAISV